MRKRTGKLVSIMEQLVTKPTSCNDAFLGDLMTSVALNEQETKMFWSGARSLAGTLVSGSRSVAV